MDRATSLQALPFSDAADKWLEQRQSFGRIIRDSTAACYRDYIARLKDFGFPPLGEIHIGHIHAYQAQRRKEYHPASVNHDINLLCQMMTQCELWAPIQPHYQPLPLPEQDPPKVMTETEEDAFFAFASEEPSWQYAYWVASLTNNTTASGKELRMLQRASVHMDYDPPYFHVPKNMKTPSRQRMIPMNERAITIMERVLKEAAKRGSTKPEHFVFPKREKRNFFNPNLPASESWLKAQWKKLVDAAVEAKIIKFRIKPHNLRHQAITKLLDCGVPIETVRQIAGHGVDSLVTRHYHHGRMEVMARALDVIDPDRKRTPEPTTSSNGRKGETA